MRKLLLILAAVAVCVGLAGCGIAYEQNASNLAKTAKAEDYGPVPADYEKAIKDLMEIVMFDPESARYSNWEGPYQGMAPSAFASPTPVLGWKVDVYINGKNRMGGYVGAKQHVFLFVNNKIYAYAEKGKYWEYVK